MGVCSVGSVQLGGSIRAAVPFKGICSYPIWVDHQFDRLDH